MAQTPSIICKDCAHVNEAQRVYCHNCGVKLDRSNVSKEQRKDETIEQKQKRVRKMMRPGGSGLFPKGSFSSLLRAVFWGAVAAVVIGVVRPPDDVPPMPEGIVSEAPPVGAYLQEISSAMAGRMLAFKEADINQYLASVLRPKGKEGEGSLPVKFQRAFVKLGTGQARITSQSAVYDYPLYMGVTVAAKNEKGNFSAKPIGLHFGRITIPEFIAQHLAVPASYLFSSLSSALKQERKDLESLGFMQLREGVMVVGSPGSTPPPAAPVAPAAPATAPAEPAVPSAPAVPAPTP